MMAPTAAKAPTVTARATGATVSDRWNRARNLENNAAVMILFGRGRGKEVKREGRPRRIYPGTRPKTRP